MNCHPKVWKHSYKRIAHLLLFCAGCNYMKYLNEHYAQNAMLVDYRESQWTHCVKFSLIIAKKQKKKKANGESK